MSRAAGIRVLAALAITLPIATTAQALQLGPLLELHGPPASGFGATLIGPGDLDRDGFPDLLVGAPLAGGGDGQVEWFRGGAPPDTSPALVIAGSGGERFGAALGALGDVNGDGWRDWAVGAPAADMDGDGYPDFAAGAPGAAGVNDAVAIWRGGPALHAATDLVLRGDPLAAFGRALAGLGEEYGLGQVTIEVVVGGLVAWPVPAHGGEPVRMSFVSPTDAAGRAPADLEVTVFDVSGRRVATLARGTRGTVVGRVSLAWDGRVDGGRARAGLYFVRASAPSAGYREVRRVVLAP